MKTKQLSVLLLLLATLTFTNLYAQEPKFEKKKSYTKSYPLSSSDKVVLSNQFGEMKIQTWDRNEVKVDATITTKSDDESRAQSRLDRITIEDDKSGNTVNFTTKFANDKERKNEDGSGRNESMSINYTVYLPATATLSATNQFGAMTVPDYRGEATLVSKFGSLTAGKIDNAKIIRVEFGDANIEQMRNGDLEVSFSSGNVRGLVGNIDAKFSHCSAIKLNIDNDAKGVKIDNSYSTLYLDMSRNFNGNYDIRTSFGDLNNKSSFAIKQQGDDNDRNQFNKRFTGTSGSGATQVKVNSSFGEVVVGHDLQVDVKAKKKNKAERS